MQFSVTKMPKLDPIKLFIPGTLSSAYDVNLMNSIIKEIRKDYNLEVTVAIGKGAEENWVELDFNNLVTLQHSEIASEIAKSHFGMSIWKPTLGICLASVSSTKIPEFLASGRPVVVNFNQGDIGGLIEEYSCGVSTSLSNERYVKQYVKELLQLLEDRDLPSRCRNLAETEYSLTNGVSRLSKVYEELIDKV
jgi:glycosyltransferase involved in cell wall biosynthesis